ncbi:MAG: hypothetical protein IM624_05730 [Phenylobacterium sp.]|uniref:hypothetical protein n=1 Tax=Phenylobacterium sp. TaxID=1871053 RepID=UPI0025F8E0DA|nr:hypothetical protein [Phenylobacterium sp.]MCA6298683.1 hypothetical protein [Phenylobacterium sp.]
MRRKRFSGIVLAGGTLAVALVVMGASPPGSKATARPRSADLAPCEAVAAGARQLGDARWTTLGGAGVESLVEMAPAAPPGSPAEARVAAQAQVRRALDLADGRAPVEVRRLPGTDIFEVSHVSGSAACQSLAFARGPPGAPATLIPSPPLQGELCGGGQAHVGRAGGAPALIQIQRSGLSPGEANAARKPLVTIGVTPWTGSGWGRTCQVELLLNSQRRLADQLCARAADCRAFEINASVLAAAFNRAKATDALQGRRATPVSYHPNPPPASTRAQVEQVRTQLARTQRELPLFGKTPKLPVMPGFSEDELDVVATQSDGRWHVAAVGFPGIGWRQDRSVTLVTVYEVGKTVVPRATYVFEDAVSGLKTARVTH